MSLASIQELFERGLIWGAEGENAENNLQNTISTQPQKVIENSCSVSISVNTFAATSTPVLKADDNYGIIGIPSIDSCLPGGGWKKGAIHEFFYSNKKFTSPPITLPSILASQNCREIFWVGRQAWPTPFLLERLNFQKLDEQKNYKDSCFFLNPKERKEVLWAIETILRGNSGCCVIADCSLLNFSLSRRLALASESSNSLLILLRDEKYARNPGSATTRWNITQTPSANDLPSWQLSLLQCRGKEPSQKIWKIGEKLIGGQYGEKISLHLSAEVERVPDGSLTWQYASKKQQSSGQTRAA